MMIKGLEVKHREPQPDDVIIEFEIPEYLLDTFDEIERACIKSGCTMDDFITAVLEAFIEENT